jgi:cytochrome c-type biogenesis protein CcmH/NrfF
MILILGAMVSMWPEVSFQEAGAFGYVRALGSVATMVMLSIVLALLPSKAFGQQQQDMRREGVVEQSSEERALFRQLLCDCGTCPHEPLETCTCGWAHQAREKVRKDLDVGKEREEIVAAYAAEHGTDAVIVQATTGANRAIWAVPMAIALACLGFIIRLSMRWRRSGANEPEVKPSRKRDAYDDKLDAELRDLE